MNFNTYKSYYGHGGFTHAVKINITQMKVSSVDHRTLYPKYPLVIYKIKQPIIHEEVK